MTVSADVQRIIEILDFRRAPTAMTKKRLLRWFDSNEPNVIGAAVGAALLNWECVRPALTRSEVGNILMKNFEVSLESAGEKLSPYAYNCHEAAKEFYVWVLQAHAALPDVEAENCVAAAIEFLERRYRAGDVRQRNCIVSGALEHLFEIDDLRNRFSAWEGDAALREAYSAATEWSTWALERMRSLREVAARTADLLRQRDVRDATAADGSIGTATAVVQWHDNEQHELVISCDEAWVEAFRSNNADVERAAAFAANRSNWSESMTHFSVEISGARFTR